MVDFATPEGGETSAKKARKKKDNLKCQEGARETTKSKAQGWGKKEKTSETS